MLTVILGLFKNWRALIGIGIAIVLAASIALLIHERNTARFMLMKAQQLIGQQKAQIDQLQGDVTLMTAEVKKQNAAALALADAAQQAQQASDQAIARARQQTASDAARVAALTARAADKTNQGSCDDEIARIRASL